MRLSYRWILGAALAVALSAPARAQDGPLVAGAEGVPVPKRARFVRPVYPPAAAAEGLRGIVILELVIGPDGSVTNIVVIRSVPPFDDAATAAAEQWTYEPTVIDGKPVSVRLTVPITFLMKLPEVTRQEGIPELRSGAVPPFPAQTDDPTLVTAFVTLAADGQVAQADILEGDSPWTESLISALRTWRFDKRGLESGKELSFRVEALYRPKRGGVREDRVEIELKGLQVSDLQLAVMDFESGVVTDTNTAGSAGAAEPGAAPGLAPAESSSEESDAAQPIPAEANPAESSPAESSPAQPDLAEPSPEGPNPTESTLAPETIADPAGVSESHREAPAAEDAEPVVTESPDPEAPTTPESAEASPDAQAPAETAAAVMETAGAGDAVTESDAPATVGDTGEAPGGPPTTDEMLDDPETEILTSGVVPEEPLVPLEPGISSVRGVFLEPGVPDLSRGRQPITPPFARIEGLDGDVTVRFAVDASGEALVNAAEGPEVFRLAARTTVESWFFPRQTARRLYMVARFEYRGAQASATVAPDTGR